MSVIYAAIALAVGAAVWWWTPMVLDWLRLGAFGDFGQVCAVILVLSVLERISRRFLP